MEDPPSEALHASRPCPHPGAKVTQAGSSCVTPRSKWSPVTGPAGQRPPRSGQGCRGTQWAERPSEGSEHEAARTPPPRSLAPSHQSPASQPQGAQLPPGTLLLPPLTGKLHQGSRGVWETGSCRDQSFLCEDHPCCLPLPLPPPHTGHAAGAPGVLEPTVLPGAALQWWEEASGQRIRFPSCQGNLGLQATS